MAIYNMISEFLKEHRKVERHEATIAELKNGCPATERNGGSHGAAQRVGSANPEGERAA